MGVARFFFHDLCEQPLAAADYLRIAHEFHTLIIDRIPVMGFDQRNAAKRFIILIDTLYDHAVKLIASAAAEPDALYAASDGFEAAEFKRTASRLIEMRSQAYLALPHGRRDFGRQRIERGHRRDLKATRRARCRRLTVWRRRAIPRSAAPRRRTTARTAPRGRSRRSCR